MTEEKKISNPNTVQPTADINPMQTQNPTILETIKEYSEDKGNIINRISKKSDSE